jgi:hypothetical protein
MDYNRKIYIAIRIPIGSNWNLDKFPIEIPVGIPIGFLVWELMHLLWLM